MRLITYASSPGFAPRSGVRVGHRVLDIENASRVDGEPLPSSMKALLREGRGALSRVQALARKAQSDAGRFAGAFLEERAIRFLPPVPDPERLLCAGDEHGDREADELVKLDSCLVGHEAKVAVAAAGRRLEREPQLVFVIGRPAHGVKGDEALEYAVGVTLLSGLADRDAQKPEAKGAPGFAPLGPEIVTMDEIDDPYDLWLTCAVNGEERMRANMRDPVSKLFAILEPVSRTTPLEPGDMLVTGSAGGDAAGKSGTRDLRLKPGDVVECSIEGITTLRTPIVAAGA